MIDPIAIISLVLEVFSVLLQVIYHVINSILKNLVPAYASEKSVEGETILITGAGSGLGRLLSEKLALRHGAKIVCVDVNAEANAETVNNINNQQGSAIGFACDLSNEKDVQSLEESVKSAVGDIDILINNAGVVTGTEFLLSSNKMNRLSMAVNTESHFWTAKAFLPAMIKKNHGHIVTVASAAGLVGIHKLADYCASKFGAVGFAESLMAELSVMGKDGVKSTLVCPYFISTGMFDGAATRFSAIMPILTPEYVTDKIIEAMLQNQEILMMPRLVYLMVMVKSIMPVKATMVLSNFLGAGDMMASFTGRK